MSFKRFDSLVRYRIAAIVLIAPIVLVQLGVDRDIAKVILWVGLAWLWFSLGWDTWKVYRGRREVRKMIHRRLKDAR
jgi:hypothetical protein